MVLLKKLPYYFHTLLFVFMIAPLFCSCFICQLDKLALLGPVQLLWPPRLGGAQPSEKEETTRRVHRRLPQAGLILCVLPFFDRSPYLKHLQLCHSMDHWAEGSGLSNLNFGTISFLFSLIPPILFLPTQKRVLWTKLFQIQAHLVALTEEAPDTMW